MLKPQVMYSDHNFIVINKPAGMIVNNADTSRDQYTIQDWVNETHKVQNINYKEESSSEFLKRGGIVHRLDKETSGALIIALNEEAFVFLQSQFNERTVEKVYTALCHGKMASEGEINVPIGRLPWNRMRFGVIPQGRESYTKFRTIAHKRLVDNKVTESVSLVEAYPKTGRTHQIRVHFQYIGHPIFADSLYSGRKTFQKDSRYLSRHFLHASKISFVSPTTQENVVFEVPITTDLRKFLDTLSS